MAIDFPNSLPTVSGAITAFAYQDPDSDANTVLEIDRAWTLEVKWRVVGAGAHHLAGGPWHLMIKIESIGEGDEKTMINLTKPGTEYDTGSDPSNLFYTQKITIPARNPHGDPWMKGCVNQPGVYRLLVVLTHSDGVFKVPDRVAGFLEGPLLQFYHFDID
jgi:hypothetical protein